MNPVPIRTRLAICFIALVFASFPLHVSASATSVAFASASLTIKGYSNSDTTEVFQTQPAAIGTTGSSSEWVDGEDGFVELIGNADGSASSQVTSTAGSLGGASSGFRLAVESSTFALADDPFGIATAVVNFVVDSHTGQVLQVPGPVQTTANLTFTNLQTASSAVPSFWTVDFHYQWSFLVAASGDDPTDEDALATAFPYISYQTMCSPPAFIPECLKGDIFTPFEQTAVFPPGQADANSMSGDFQIRLYPSRKVNGVPTTFPINVELFAEAMSTASDTPEPGTLLLFGSGVLGFGGYLRKRLLTRS